MKFCPKCENYLYMDTKSGKSLLRVCRTCGFSENDTQGGLAMETVVQERSSEGYKILLNEFTRQDPTLPHVVTIKCPKATCITNTGKQQRDVIYIKYDAVNLKYLYICNVCGEQWRSRS